MKVGFSKDKTTIIWGNYSIQKVLISGIEMFYHLISQKRAYINYKVTLGQY